MNWNLVPPSLVSRLFIIIDPLGSIPFFLIALRPFSAKRARQITLREMIIALVVMLVFVFIGSELLHILGVDSRTMGISGGSILFVIALKMLFDHQNSSSDSNVQEPFIFPLAVPLVVGPAVFATLVEVNRSFSLIQILCSLFVAWSLSTPILLAAPTFQRFIGQGGVQAIEKIMGLILLTLSFQMAFDAVTQFFRA